MRTRLRELLLVGTALFLSAAACSATTSADEVCTSAAGVCLAVPDGGNGPVGCGEQLNGLPCDPGFICCTAAPATTPIVYTDGGSTTTTTTTTTTDAATGG